MSPLRPAFRRYALWLGTSCILACTTPSSAPGSTNADASVDPTDAGVAADVVAPLPFPAFPPSPPQVVSTGGPVLKTPRIVAVVFDGDPLASEIDSFVGEMGKNPDYWAQTTSEYGVGPLASVKTIVAHEPPPATVNV